MILINFLLTLFLITTADVKANAQTCISLFEEQKIISKLAFEQQEILMSLAQHQVEVTSNPIIPQAQKNQILQQIESQLTNFMRDMEFNSYETKLFLTEYRALVFKAKEKLNPNIDLQIAEVENRRNIIKEAQSKREKIELIKKKYWEFENLMYFKDDDLLKKIPATLDHALWSIINVDVLTKEHIDDFKLILEFGGDPFSIKFERQAFFVASINDHHKLIELMLGTGIDVNTKAAKNHEYEGKTALMIASKLGNTNTVRVLLNKGANPDIFSSFKNSFSPFGETALQFACIEGHVEIVKLLIEHKVDINLLVPSNPLHLAVEHGHLDIVKLLVQSGANTKARNASDKTPLQHALDNNQTAIADFLEAHAKSYPLSKKIKDRLIDIRNYFKGERK